MLSIAMLSSLAVVFASSVAYFLHLGYQKRKLVYQLRRDGIVSRIISQLRKNTTDA